MSKITLHSGLLVDPLNLHPIQITIRDIAISLARIPRFGGHARCRYTVAMHSLIGAEHLLKKAQYEDAIGFLLHDAPEAYLGIDVPGPYKHKVRIGDESIADVEDRIARTIIEAFGLKKFDWTDNQLSPVKELDRAMLYYELGILTNHVGAYLSCPKEIDLLKYINESDLEVAETFESMFSYLSNKLNLRRP